jgi:hypothetical protein
MNVENFFVEIFSKKSMILGLNANSTHFLVVQLLFIL